MRFFEQQRIDAAGIKAVQLEKIILFLAFWKALGFLDFNFFSLITTTVSLAILYVGFRGAVTRNERMLRFFYSISLFCMFLMAFFMFFGTMSAQSEQPQMVNMPNIQSNNSSTAPIAERVISGDDDNSNSTQMIDVNSAAPNNASLTPTLIIQSQVHTSITAGFFILLFVISLVFLILKFSAIILACQIVRLLRVEQARNLAHPVSKRLDDTLPVYIPIQVQPNAAFNYTPMYNNANTSQQFVQPQFVPPQFVPNAYPVYYVNPTIPPQQQHVQF